jgi:biopolymer transport protein TolQ
MEAFARIFIKNIKFLILTYFLALGSFSNLALAKKATKEADKKAAQTTEVEKATEVSQMSLGSQSVLSRSIEAGPVVFLVLLTLMVLSVASWGVSVAKYLHLKKVAAKNDEFIERFWENKSLNDLNSKLVNYEESPAKELFKAGYSELVKGSQLKDQAADAKVGIDAAMSNLHRTLTKSKSMEKKKMEKLLPLLAIIASTGPFIGLFGTVWGIMTAFEGIAQTGSASLAAVAPGISEALIATAFGLAAAIPAVVGYNMANNFIRKILINIDGFGSDFMNIVERYLVTDSKPSKSSSSAPRI